MDRIDVHNTIDTMKFSSFVDDYMYDDDFCNMCYEAHVCSSLRCRTGLWSRYSC